MARSVLVPLDGSDPSLAALEYALETFEEPRLTLFHAIDPFDEAAERDDDAPLTRDWLAGRREAADSIFEEALDRIEADVGDATVETDVAVGSPAQAILGYVDDEDVEQVVLGSHGRGGASDLRLGSVSEVVVRRASVPVTVVR